MSLPIDLNCDMGESYGRFRVGSDEELLDWITSCNLACGFHGGDPLTIERTARAALQRGVRIGAHPSFPDLAGFGRRLMHLPAEELRTLLKYQIAAVAGMVGSLGGRIDYVKPHGALYNHAAADAPTAAVVVQAVAEMGTGLALMGPAGSAMERAAAAEGLPFIREAFLDRAYAADGSLLPRDQPNAVITDPRIAAARMRAILQGASGLPPADSLCVHGDNPAALLLLQAVHREIKSPER